MSAKMTLTIVKEIKKMSKQEFINNYLANSTRGQLSIQAVDYIFSYLKDKTIPVDIIDATFIELSYLDIISKYNLQPVINCWNDEVHPELVAEDFIYQNTTLLEASQGAILFVKF